MSKTEVTIARDASGKSTHVTVTMTLKEAALLAQVGAHVSGDGSGPRGVFTQMTAQVADTLGFPDDYAEWKHKSNIEGELSINE